MPIISRQLDYARQQADGRFRCRVSGLDSVGRRWIHGPFWSDTVVAAEAIRDGVVWDVEQAELDDAQEFIAGGGNPNAFPLVDLTTIQYRRRIIRLAARLPLSGNEQFLCNIAAFIAGFTAAQIASAVGIPLAIAQKVLDRANRLNSTICPSFTLDDADVQEDL